MFNCFLNELKRLLAILKTKSLFIINYQIDKTLKVFYYCCAQSRRAGSSTCFEPATYGFVGSLRAKSMGRKK